MLGQNPSKKHSKRHLLQQSQQNSQLKQEVRIKHLETNPGNMMGIGFGNAQLGSHWHNHMDFGVGLTGINTTGPSKVFTQIQHGSSSATNKVKKAFDFDVDAQQKLKRDRKIGFSTATGHPGVVSTKKTISFNKKMKQNICNIPSGNANKKLSIQKPANIKTQMNLTGPLPKNILSPSTVTNQSQGKSKHSQYFDTSSEIVGTQYHQQYLSNMNSQQQYNLTQGTPSNIQQQRYQVQVNSGNQGGPGQHQITTSGGNTVININIDSNAWQHPPRDRSYPEPKEHEVLDAKHSRNVVYHAQSYNSKPQQQQPQQQHQVQYLNINNQNSANRRQAGMKSKPQQYQKPKRLSSSKMRRQDSVSSNKSKQNNRRSNSSSHMQNNSHLFHNMGYNQQEIISQNIAMINERLLRNQLQQQQNQQLQININKMMDHQVPMQQQVSSKSKSLGNKIMHLQKKQIMNATTGGVVDKHHQQQVLMIPQRQKQPQLTRGSSNQALATHIDLNQSQKVKTSYNTKLVLKKFNIQNTQQKQNQNQILQQMPRSQIGSARSRGKDVMLSQQQQEMLNNMENQIKQDQIRLRHELAEIQSQERQKKASYNTHGRYYNQGQTGMDVEMETDEAESIEEIQPNFMHQQRRAHKKSHAARNMSNDNSYITSIEAQSVQQMGSQMRKAKKTSKRQNSNTDNPSSTTQSELKTKSAAGSTQGRQNKVNRISNSKLNIDELNLNFEEIMNSGVLVENQSQGFNIPLHGFATKQAVTTKNQSNNKLLTQNVQTILREAKREMLIDPNLDQIEVGGDDLTQQKKQKKKKINFNGTQMLPFGSNNFLTQEQRLNVQYGISPKNQIEETEVIPVNAYNTNNYKTNQTVVNQSSNLGTFGLGQLKKKQMIAKPVNVAAQQQNQVQSQFIFQVQKQKDAQNKPMQSKVQQTGQIQTKQISRSQVHSISNNNTQFNSKTDLKQEPSKKHLTIADRKEEQQPPIKAEEKQGPPPTPSMPQLPLSGAKVLKHYLKIPGLTEYEKSEILDYKECYFLGIGADKIKGSKNHQYNFGFDDERGDYNVVLKDHIAYRFEVISFLGKGSFGQALKCQDHKTGETVAVKIIRNNQKYQHQAGVELKILLHLKENDQDDANNIIRIKDYCMFRSHLIISFELFSINLYEFIKNNNFEGVSLSLIRRFAIQILQALKYLKEENLIHCDLKPENILLKSPDKSGIKVIDFGSSCFANEMIYTYIQSRFYRAPEIILGITYTPAIDMWSLGCILTELFTGMPIFPGESEQEQLSLIMEVIGLPNDHILSLSTRKNVFFDQNTGEPYLTKNSQNDLRIPGSKPLADILLCQSDTFLDFISRCLEWDPEKRITPFEALMHDWIIEGLPPQLLVHHQKMLGIYESETEDEMINQSKSMADDVEQFDSAENNRVSADHFYQFQESQELSSSQLQMIEEQFQEGSQQDLQIGNIIQNNLNNINPMENYADGVQGTEYQDYEKYDSIIMNHGNGNKKQLDSKEFSRAGAMQENFNKTGKQNFQGLKLKQNNIYLNQAQQIGLRGVQNSHHFDPNIMQFDDIVNEEQKSKTAHMSEILQQVNKKSKSTKNNTNKNQLFHQVYHQEKQQRPQHTTLLQKQIKRNSFLLQQ